MADSKYVDFKGLKNVYEEEMKNKTIEPSLLKKTAEIFLDWLGLGLQNILTIPQPRRDGLKLFRVKDKTTLEELLELKGPELADDGKFLATVEVKSAKFAATIYGVRDKLADHLKSCSNPKIGKITWTIAPDIT